MASIIRLDKVKGYPVSFVNSIANLENGQFLVLKGLHKGGSKLGAGTDREAYAIEKATKTATGTLVLNATVPFLYDERLLETDFVLKEGQVGRAYILERGDIVTIADTFAGAVNVGDSLGLDANGKLSATETPKIVEVIAKEKFSGQNSIVIQCL